MTEIDNGHAFAVSIYDAKKPTVSQKIYFMKRSGTGYPGNENSYPGTNSQEVTRVLIARTKYLDNQIPSFWNSLALFGYRLALWAYEKRAAARHNRKLRVSFTQIEHYEFCCICGHIGCEGRHLGRNS